MRILHDLRRPSLVGGGLLLLGLGMTPIEVVRAQTIRGTVVEDSTQGPIADAVLFLLSADGTVVPPTSRSGPDGRFMLRSPRLGTFRVRAVRIGYEPVTSQPIALRYGELATIRLVMTVVPAKVMTVAVTEKRNFTPRELTSTVGFELRRARGIGSFLTSRELDELGLVGDIATRVPGLNVRGGLANERLEFFIPGGGRCLPAIYLDGVAAPYHHVAALGVESLHAVEVYKRWQELPLRLRGDLNASCGLIAFWTTMQVFRDSIAGVAALRSGRARTGVQVIRGLVVDFETERPLAGVPIALLSQALDRFGENAQTDSLGEFVIRTKRIGDMRLEVGTLGFTASITPDFLLSAEELVRVRLFASATRPVEAPMAVASRALPEDFSARELGGFDYREGRGTPGVFFRAEEIARRGATSLHELVAGVEGVTITGAGSTSTLTLRGNAKVAPCVPTYLLDGARVRAGIADSTVRALSMSRVLGVELYRASAEVPAPFADLTGTCGMIGIWRRQD